MKRVLALFVAFAFCAVAFSPRPTPALGRSQEAQGKLRKVERAITDQYIVVLKDDLPGREVAAAARDLAGFHGGQTRHVYQHALKGFSVRLTEAAARALSQHPLVEYVEEDGEVSILPGARRSSDHGRRGDWLGFSGVGFSGLLFQSRPTRRSLRADHQCDCLPHQRYGDGLLCEGNVYRGPARGRRRRPLPPAQSNGLAQDRRPRDHK